MNAQPQALSWWTHFPILQQNNTLIGSGGYKGPPDETGWVEIGYELAPRYRGQGLATEFAQLLVEKAWKSSEVQGILAHTLGEENASGAILKKMGFARTQILTDSEVGIIWCWELARKPELHA